MSTRTGRRARHLDRGDGRDRGVRDGDDLVARADAERAQREVERRRCRCRRRSPCAHADVRRELRLEGADLVAEDVPSALEDAARRPRRSRPVARYCAVGLAQGITPATVHFRDVDDATCRRPRGSASSLAMISSAWFQREEQRVVGIARA